MRRRALLGIKQGGGQNQKVEPYLTFVVVSSATFKFSRSNCMYRINEGSWKSLSANTQTPTISAGSVVQFKSENLTPSSGYGIGTFTISGTCDVRGNIMSMLYGDNAEGQYSLADFPYAFRDIFKKSNAIRDASMLYLPATTLSERCYYAMFESNVNLIAAPILPATKLSARCYYRMFYGCTKLTDAPILPALTVSSYGYYYMFYGCSNLKYIKAMMTSTPSSPNTLDWVNGVSATGTFVKNRAATWDVIGANGVPSGWTIEYADA